MGLEKICGKCKKEIISDSLRHIFEDYIVTYVPSSSNSGNPKKVYYHIHHYRAGIFLWNGDKREVRREK